MKPNSRPLGRAIRHVPMLERLELNIWQDYGVRARAQIVNGNLVLTTNDYADFVLARCTAVEKYGYDRANITRGA